MKKFSLLKIKIWCQDHFGNYDWDRTQLYREIKEKRENYNDYIRMKVFLEHLEEKELQKTKCEWIAMRKRHKLGEFSENPEERKKWNEAKRRSNDIREKYKYISFNRSSDTLPVRFSENSPKE